MRPKRRSKDKTSRAREGYTPKGNEVILFPTKSDGVMFQSLTDTKSQSLTGQTLFANVPLWCRANNTEHAMCARLLTEGSVCTHRFGAGLLGKRIIPYEPTLPRAVNCGARFRLSWRTLPTGVRCSGAAVRETLPTMIRCDGCGTRVAHGPPMDVVGFAGWRKGEAVARVVRCGGRRAVSGSVRREGGVPPGSGGRLPVVPDPRPHLLFL